MTIGFLEILVIVALVFLTVVLMRRYGSNRSRRPRNKR